MMSGKMCFYLILPLISDALLHTRLPVFIRQQHAMPLPSTTLHSFSNKGEKSRSKISKFGSKGGDDLVSSRDIKDEALLQAQTAVSSLEAALESAVSSLENMQQQLQSQVLQLQEELEASKQELSNTQSELKRTQLELQKARDDLVRSQKINAQLELALEQNNNAVATAGKLDLKSFIDDSNIASAQTISSKKNAVDPWQLFSTSQKVIPVLNDWIAIRGTNDGEIQISGKVTNHPTIPDGDAIVTSPLVDASKAAEKKIVTTLSGSKYRLATPMNMPSSDAASLTITSPEKKKSSQPLIKARSSISIPDLTGSTIGNGRYLLAGEATSSINGRSFIQTVYRASPFGKPVGEPLIVKYSSNKDAMKREYSNYQKVSNGLAWNSSFIRRVEFLSSAGDEMPGKSALIMQRGVADVKAFMPKVGGKLDGELLLDCASTALRCIEALHAVKLVWNDLKTENFVVIDDEKGGVTFRAIDLESCMAVKTAPVDYTPEACPPEFARSFLNGDVESFSLEYSYDVWSYGMFLYEISTGRGFFDGMSVQKITTSLPTFTPNLEKVEDPVLANLISQCLSRNPSDRPTVTRIFKHPFFADSSSNKNPFDFLFGYSI